MFFSRKVTYDTQTKGREGLFTPDLWKLEQYDFQLLFISDTLKYKHPNNRMVSPFSLSGASLGSCWSEDDNWGFWKFKQGKDSYPIPLVNRNHHNTWRNKIGRIRGELYAIRPYTIIDLDNYYQNRIEFNRIRTSVIMPYTKHVYTDKGKFISPEFTQNIRCWMYVGIPKVWEKELDGGMQFEPVNLLSPKKKDYEWFAGNYFYWSHEEYNR